MPQKYNISKEFIEKEYFENNKSQDEIAKMLGISQWVISQRMMEFSLKPKENTRKLWQRKYFVDDNFFDELNPTNAWVLGWLASDGYINENGNALRFGMTIAKKDQDIIGKIKILLKFNGKTYSRKTFLKKTGKEYEQVVLNITSQKIVNRLKLFGLSKNKTESLSFPKLIKDAKNKEIMRAFIQGFFEGDGSLLFDEKHKSPCFQIVGTQEMLLEIQTELINYVKLKKTKLTKYRRSKNHFALRYRGRFQTMKIMDWIYSDTNNYLDRKYNKYLDIKRRLIS